MKKLMTTLLLGLFTLTANATYKETKRELRALKKELNKEIRKDKSFRNLIKKSIKDDEAALEVEKRLAAILNKQNEEEDDGRGFFTVESESVFSIGYAIYNEDWEVAYNGSFPRAEGYGLNIGVSKGRKFEICRTLAKAEYDWTFPHRNYYPVMHGFKVYAVVGVGIATGIYLGRMGDRKNSTRQQYYAACIDLTASYGFQVGVNYHGEY